MFTIRCSSALVCALFLVACNPFHKNQAVEMSTGDATLNTAWHANLASPANLAGAVQMSGSASMAPHRNGTHTIVEVSLANAAPGGLHPWAVHMGQCGRGTDRGVFGSDGVYEQLRVDSKGRADGKATIPQRTPEAGGFFVVLYASEANAKTVVACGNLAAPTR